jgi:hypothetical protein
VRLNHNSFIEHRSMRLFTIGASIKCCAVLVHFSIEFSGVNIEGVTPLPIPNREVKPLGADGTMLVTVWESRTMPDFISDPSSFDLRGLFFVERPCGRS